MSSHDYDFKYSIPLKIIMQMDLPRVDYKNTQGKTKDRKDKEAVREFNKNHNPLEYAKFIRRISKAKKDKDFELAEKIIEEMPEKIKESYLKEQERADRLFKKKDN